MKRFSESMMEAYERQNATPSDLLEAARNNVIVARFIDGWKAGHWPLEKALIMACVHLATENARLSREAVMQEMLRERQAPAIVSGEPFGAGVRVTSGWRSRP